MNTVELSKQACADAVASIKRYIEENFEEPVGEMKAGFLLDYFLEEVGPVVYNQAIRDAQTRLGQRVADLDGELYTDEFTYWPKKAGSRAEVLTLPRAASLLCRPRVRIFSPGRQDP